MELRVAVVNFSAALAQDEAGAHNNSDTYYYSTQKGALIAYLRSRFPEIAIDLIGYSKDATYRVCGRDKDRAVYLPNINSDSEMLLSLIYNILLPFQLLKSRPSLVYAYTDGVLHPYVTALLTAKVLRVPAFLDLRNLPYCCYIDESRPRYIRAGVKATDRLCLRLCDAIVCISEGCREALSGSLGKKAVVVPSCAAGVFFREAAAGIGGNKRMVFACWGVMDKTRRLDVLIRGFARAQAADPAFSAELVLIGDGDHRAELETIAQAVSPSGITFLGYMHQQELAAFLRTVSVAVIPIPPDKEYFRTSSPLKLAESIALGLPMLASDIEPNRIVAEQALGIICDHSEAGYADAFLRFSRMPDTALEACRERCRMLKDTVRPASVFAGIGALLRDRRLAG